MLAAVSGRDRTVMIPSDAEFSGSARRDATRRSPTSTPGRNVGAVPTQNPWAERISRTLIGRLPTYEIVAATEASKNSLLTSLRGSA